MTFQQLIYLVEISKQGTISKAAKSLFVSQPCISKAIKELEENLNIEIFVRKDNKRLQFTPEGMELLVAAREILEQVDQIQRKPIYSDKNKPMRLMVSSQHYAFVVKAFIAMLKKHKNSIYEFLLREKKTRQVIEDVYLQQSQLGIIFISNSTKNFMRKFLDSKNIEFNSLCKVGFHAFIRKGHPLGKKDYITLEDLANYPFISYEQENYSLNFSEEAVNINTNQSINVLDRATMNNIICHTDSYNIGTGFLIKGIIEKEIISIPISDLSDKMDIGWIKLRNTILTKEAEDFLYFCTKYLNDQPK